MKDFFFSIKASYYLFSLLAVLFGIGTLLAKFDDYHKIFKLMTSTDLIYSLKEIITNPVVFIWLLAFIFTGGCLLINTCCCVIQQIKSIFILRKISLSSNQIALIHIVALAVIVLHVFDISLIKRHIPTRFYVGESIEMGSYKVKLDKIFYVADKSLITEDYKGTKIKATHLPANKFLRKDNYALIEIQKAGKESILKKIKMLSPARTGNTYFFLDGFFIANGDNKIGIQIHYSYNPLVFAFFTTYLTLLSLLLWRYMTFKNNYIY